MRKGPPRRWAGSCPHSEPDTAHPRDAGPSTSLPSRSSRRRFSTPRGQRRRGKAEAGARAGERRACRERREGAFPSTDRPARRLVYGNARYRGFSCTSGGGRRATYNKCTLATRSPRREARDAGPSTSLPSRSLRRHPRPHPGSAATRRRPAAPRHGAPPPHGPSTTAWQTGPVSAPEELRRRPVGVFDSGVGGLTVLHELLVQLPHEDFVYFADAARFPYGERTRRSSRRSPGDRRGAASRGGSSCSSWPATRRPRRRCPRCASG